MKQETRIEINEKTAKDFADWAESDTDTMVMQCWGFEIVLTKNSIGSLTGYFNDTGD